MTTVRCLLISYCCCTHGNNTLRTDHFLPHHLGTSVPMAFFPTVDVSHPELVQFSEARLRAHRERLKQSCNALLYKTIGAADQNKR